MFQLDDQFLADVGLSELAEEQKKPFLQHTYDQLEYRVGIQLSEGMSDEQLQQFEAIIDRKPEVVSTWLAENTPDFQTDPLFTRLLESSKLPAEDPVVQAEYAATKWLEVNRPDYRDVVAATLADIKNDIIQNKDAILGASNHPAA